MNTTSVRYIVSSVDEAIPFYERLGFTVDMHPAPAFARLVRGNLALLLNQPGGGGGAGAPASDGRTPEPGGWNRFQIEVDDLEAMMRDLKASGATVRTDVVQGIGGLQAVLDDPSGNPVELFQPR